jgi:hypothetical protein
MAIPVLPDGSCRRASRASHRAFGTLAERRWRFEGSLSQGQGVLKSFPQDRQLGTKVVRLRNYRNSPAVPMRSTTGRSIVHWPRATILSTRFSLTLSL